MKKQLSLAICLLIAINLWGQNIAKTVKSTTYSPERSLDNPLSNNKKHNKALPLFNKESITKHNGMPLFLSDKEKSQAYMIDSVFGSQWLNEEWMPEFKISSTYSFGRMDTSITYTFTGGTWVFREMSIFDYNSSGNLSAKTTFLWKNNAWAESIRLSLNYHQNQAVEQELELTYIPSFSYWDTTRFGLYDNQSYTLMNFYKAYNTETGEAEWGIRYNYEYNSADSSFNIQMGWESDKNEWVNLSSNFYRSAGENHSQLEITKDWQNNTWANKQYTEEAFDANMNPVLYMEKSGLNTTSWKNEYRNQYYYSNNLLDSTIFAHGINNTSWQNSMKTSNTYNNEGNLTIETNYNWNLQTNHWENSGKKELYYNSGELTDSVFGFFWDSNSNKFVPSTREYFTYDEMLQLTEKLFQNWSIVDSVWENYERYQYWYLTNGSHNMVQTWSWQGWMPYSENGNYHNEEGLNTEYYTMYYTEGVPSYGYRGLTEYTEYNFMDTYITQEINASTGEWVNSYRYKYHYSLHETTGIATNNELTKLLFPNPAKAGQVVRLKTNEEGFAKITSLSGVTLHSQIIGPGGHLQIPASFSTGQYIVSFNEKKGGTQKHFKLIVE